MSKSGRGKRFVFLMFILLILLVLSEIGSFAVLSALRSSLASPGALQKDRNQIRQEMRRRMKPGNDPGKALQEFMKVEVLHPYLGFVIDRETKAKGVRSEGVDVSPYGLMTDNGVPYLATEPDPDRVVVGIFGGSVAFWFSLQGEEKLAEELRKDPRYAGKEFHFVRVAWGGYKQPQQLIGLNYLLTLGAHFDLAIAIDGFNEVALSYNENLAHGVAEVFPRSWHWRISNAPDAEIRRLIGLFVYTSDRRRQLANTFSTPPLAYSFTCNLLWSVLDRRAETKAGRAQREVQEVEARKGTTRSFAATGPYVEPANDDEAFERIAAQWRRASIQMHRTCEANGIRYYQFLQPNQYVPDSKPMGAEERKIAFQDDHQHRGPVVEGYPRLIDSAAELRAAGVRFHDLTQIFADVDEPIYVDTCCHMGPEGNEKMAEVIAQAITNSD